MKGISLDLARAIVGERERGGPYCSLADLLRRTGLPRQAAERLIAVGALSEFGLGRRELLWQLGLLLPEGTTYGAMVRSSSRAPAEATHPRHRSATPGDPAPPNQASTLAAPPRESEGSAPGGGSTWRGESDGAALSKVAPRSAPPRPGVSEGAALGGLAPRLAAPRPGESEGSALSGVVGLSWGADSGSRSRESEGSALGGVVGLSWGADSGSRSRESEGSALGGVVGRSPTFDPKKPFSPSRGRGPGGGPASQPGSGTPKPRRPNKATARSLPLDLGVEQDMVRLPDMDDWERMVADYGLLGLSPTYHPMGLLRESLSPDVLTNDQLRKARDGSLVRTAGLVVCRQRPGTAKGFVFLLLEDETGLTNVVIGPDLYEARRGVVRGEPYLWIEGTLQVRSGSLNLLARRVAAMEAVPTRLLPQPRQEVVHPDNADDPRWKEAFDRTAEAAKRLPRPPLRHPYPGGAPDPREQPTSTSANRVRLPVPGSHDFH
ncbi:MAG: hypothetical protein HYX52_00500 [Chloroflexi bacterium]|nr:hypothetical protein [Chloroflexota bacterium]